MSDRRLIPKLLLKSSQKIKGKKVLVTTKQYSNETEVGDPVSQAKIYEAQAADELVFLDLDRSKEGLSPLLQILEKVSEEIFMPIAVGGGISTLDDIRNCLKSGADKVVLNTKACNDPTFISKSAEKFGSQAIVVSIDIRREDNQFSVWTERATKRFSRDLLSWAKEVQTLGAGEILVNSIDRDGMRSGLEVDAIQGLTSILEIPVILSGGAGKAHHFVEAFQKGGVNGVAAGTFFCFKDENPMQTRSRISNAGIPIRIQI